jgi:hypothetical protein
VLVSIWFVPLGCIFGVIVGLVLGMASVEAYAYLDERKFFRK